MVLYAACSRATGEARFVDPAAENKKERKAVFERQAAIFQSQQHRDMMMRYDAMGIVDAVDSSQDDETTKKNVLCWLDSVPIGYTREGGLKK